MKVKLTEEEFKAILSKHFSMEVSEFEIVMPDPSPKGLLLRKAITDPFDKNNFVGNIKRLRDVVMSMGKYITLAEARWAIDNWVRFLMFVDENNRLPKGGYGSGNNKGILM